MSLLKTLDEENVYFTNENYLQMINDINSNKECTEASRYYKNFRSF